MTSAIAIVGMACRYPDASSPVDLWENSLAQRRAFRRIPGERLRLEDYLSPDGKTGDTTYSTQAAVIEGYEFDRVGFRVAGSTFRSADLAHWLALDVATKALADAGFILEDEIPREATGVIVGNTLTGEFSRASIMRLRWPYVRRVLDPLLTEKGFSPQQREKFFNKFEAAYKGPFPPLGEETLAGGLSNTIAGRICNQFDFKGGGYTVDGACASSLLAVTTACSALAAGDLDMALAGGVDLSIDPFELVGFARTSALAREEMRVYDARSNGFWPGEGCGFVVLMRHEDAIKSGRPVYALIRGWGVSSDGNGGITRPEVEGQLLALKRAYGRARFGIDTVAYFEGHGTGTSVGDATELRVLSRARREIRPDGPPAFISSIKANIGHTKAAAGVAGLIKATMALHTQIVPPATGCKEPHPEISGDSPALRVLSQATPWPSDMPLRAGVSAMGFGGINTHVVLEKPAVKRRLKLQAHECAIARSAQDAELFLLGARDADELAGQVAHLLTISPRISFAELSDLAALLERSLKHSQFRAAVVASSAEELTARLDTLKTWLAEGVESQLNIRAGVFLGKSSTPPKIGFLFPGQGSPSHISGGAIRRRFEYAEDPFALANLPEDADAISTRFAQPAIMANAAAALRVLERLGIKGSVGVGHSLGELAALHWAGGFDERSLLQIAAGRGKAMAELGDPDGAMASIRAGRREVESLISNDSVAIAGLNAPQQTVISGRAADVAAVIARAQAGRIAAVELPVSHAFHSSYMEAAIPALEECLSEVALSPLHKKVISTVTGALLPPDADLRQLLKDQITSPVRFEEAVRLAAKEADLFIEVGPGEVLGRLIEDFIPTPVLSLDSGGSSLNGLLKAAGAAYVMGSPVRLEALFADRFTKRFDLGWQPKFFVNPCELAPLPEGCSNDGNPQGHTVEIDYAGLEATSGQEPVETLNDSSSESSVHSTLSLVRQLVAQRAELPVSVVKDDSRLLSDLHLNSITVSQIVTEVARRLGLQRPYSPTDYADATVAVVADALEQLSSATSSSSTSEQDKTPSGIASWVRTFTVEMVERPLARRQPPAAQGQCKIFSPPGHEFGDLLRERLRDWTGDNAVIVCLPPQPDESHLGLLLEAARAVPQEPARGKFVLVQHEGGAASFARTLYLENPHVTTCIVDVPVDPKAIDWVLAEIRAAVGFVEAHYDLSGQRREPVFRLHDLREGESATPLGPDDVLLVTAGGKGITAECALSLARGTGAALVLLGLSSPEADDELAINLNRLAAAGIRHRYFAADVTDAAAVESAVKEAVSEFGPVTGILHGAAVNVPQLLRSMTREQFARTLAVKVQGARNLVAAVDVSRLKLFVAFGSIIARTGLPGESHYGLANEWLTRLTEQLQEIHPHIKCLAVEWSVWSGVGMAERIGGIERLVQAGITPITPDEGVSILLRLLSNQLPGSSVVVTGRYGNLPTFNLDQPELPLLRFLEKIRVYYPGIELVADSQFSADTDYYLDDHAIQGERLLPAVIGLEAMAQAAIALTGSARPPDFENVEFLRPIVVPEGESLTVRVAALASGPDRVDVALRSQETGFQVDHFRATCNFRRAFVAGEDETISRFEGEIVSPLLPLDPARDLYGAILFHKGRFQRLRGYHSLKSKECFAEMILDGAKPWFGRYLPATLCLGDPGARDTAIHAIQACIPHSTILPVGVDRIVTNAGETSDLRFAHARERLHESDTFTYDLEAIGGDGRVIEKWEGLRLRKVGNVNLQNVWAEPLLSTYIERRISELLPGTVVTIALEQDMGADRRASSDLAIRHAVGMSVPIIRRFDGKPEAAQEVCVSASHAGQLTMAIAGSGAIACDLEQVMARPALVWRDLLGAERYVLAEVIARDAREDFDIAATRVWTAGECLKKSGTMAQAPLQLTSSTKDGWVLLSSGHLAIATFVAETRNSQGKLVISLLAASSV